MPKRKAFTLIEVLISIALLGIILVALFSVVDVMKDSNEHLHNHLLKAEHNQKVTELIYYDLLSSDGNLTIDKRDDFAKLCISSTTNSLYELYEAKVCWIVLKEENTLTRVEGNSYHLPLREEERVAIDIVMPNLERFDLYQEKEELLVIIKEKTKKSIMFIVSLPKKAPIKKGKKVK